MSDPTNTTVLALDAIARSGLYIHVDVVVGSSSSKLPAIRESVARMPVSVELHLDRHDMAGLMADADVAIGAAGSSAWERCCLGLPSIVIVTGPDQIHVADVLGRNAAASVVGERNVVAADDVAEALLDLDHEPEKRYEMSNHARRLCDGLGARRVAAVLDPERATDGGKVEFRPATRHDGPIMLNWQRAPETRRHFRTPRVPGRDEHERWLDFNLGDPDSHLNVILHCGRPAGMLRLDRIRDDVGGDRVYEVSILVAPERHRLGIGAAALVLARRLLPDAEFRAEVAAENEASHRLFRSAGYEFTNGLYRSLPGFASP